MIISILFLYSCGQHIENKENVVVAQEGNFWCWAAVAEAGLKHYGIDRNQEEIFKTYFNRAMIIPDDYLSPYAALPWGMSYMYQSRILNYQNISGRVVMFDEVTQLIDNNIPVIVLYNAHVAMITGYKKSLFSDGVEYEIMDPAYKMKKIQPFTWVSQKRISTLGYTTPFYFVCCY